MIKLKQNDKFNQYLLLHKEMLSTNSKNQHSQSEINI